jgi:hypothetical protein
MKHTLRLLAFVATGVVSSARAGDAVAVGYNADGLWAAVTYYCSSTPAGGKDYKDSAHAGKAALRDIRRRGSDVAKGEVIASSDRTGNFAVARGKPASGPELIVVGYGTSQGEADKAALEKLTEAGAAANQTVMYRYFSYGSESPKPK